MRTVPTLLSRRLVGEPNRSVSERRCGPTGGDKDDATLPLMVYRRSNSRLRRRASSAASAVTAVAAASDEGPPVVSVASDFAFPPPEVSPGDATSELRRSRSVCVSELRTAGPPKLARRARVRVGLTGPDFPKDVTADDGGVVVEVTVGVEETTVCFGALPFLALDSAAFDEAAPPLPPDEGTRLRVPVPLVSATSAELVDFFDAPFTEDGFTGVAEREREAAPLWSSSFGLAMLSGRSRNPTRLPRVVFGAELPGEGETDRGDR